MKARDRAGWKAAAALLVASCVCLIGCKQLLLAVPVEVGVALAEERSVNAVIDDMTIRIALNEIFLRDDTDLYRAVSFSVVEGRVVLKGSVPRPEDRVRAAGLAGRVDGVRQVIDELQLDGGGGAAAYVRDTWISAQLKARLLLDVAVFHINYDIETVNGVVYLNGIAQDGEELARVIGHARAMPDVRRVANHVMLKNCPRALPPIVHDRPGG